MSTNLSDMVPNADNWIPKFKVGDEIIYQGIQHTITGIEGIKYIIDGGLHVHGPSIETGMIIRHPRYDNPSRSTLSFRDPAYVVGTPRQEYEVIREEKLKKVHEEKLNNTYKKRLEEQKKNQSRKHSKITDSMRGLSSKEGGRKRKTRRNTKRRKSNRRR
jgi:hypothetical protein